MNNGSTSHWYTLSDALHHEQRKPNRTKKGADRHGDSSGGVSAAAAATAAAAITTSVSVTAATTSAAAARGRCWGSRRGAGAAGGNDQAAERCSRADDVGDSLGAVLIRGQGLGRGGVDDTGHAVGAVGERPGDEAAVKEDGVGGIDGDAEDIGLEQKGQLG